MGNGGVGGSQWLVFFTIPWNEQYAIILLFGITDPFICAYFSWRKILGFTQKQADPSPEGNVSIYALGAVVN